MCASYLYRLTYTVVLVSLGISLACISNNHNIYRPIAYTADLYVEKDHGSKSASFSKCQESSQDALKKAI